jgi:hypothetical protein
MGSSATLPVGMGDYQVCDIDTDNDIKYYGYQRSNGEFYIMKEDTPNQQYRYVFGKDVYAIAWTNRASLAYDYVQGGR